MPTPTIILGRLEGLLRFGPRSWGGDDSQQHPFTPPRVKLPSPPTPNNLNNEPQLLEPCWGLEGLIPVLISQQLKPSSSQFFRLASLPTRPFRVERRAVEMDATSKPGTQDPPTTALGRDSQVPRPGLLCCLPPGSITDMAVGVDGAPGAGQCTACTTASWGPDSTIHTRPFH
ncbi:uncharacterized protein LOC144228446 isoform X2 [Crocuta crocuta]